MAAQPIEFRAVAVSIKSLTQSCANFGVIIRLNGGFMKLLSLLVLFCAGAISLFAATRESTMPLSPASAPPAFKIGSLSLNPANNAKPPFVWPSRAGYRVTERSVESTTCYKMRAYYVVRDSRNPDVTRPDGYSTCQPAARFQVKRAIEQKMIEEGPTEPENIPSN